MLCNVGTCAIVNCVHTSTTYEEYTMTVFTAPNGSVLSLDPSIDGPGRWYARSFTTKVSLAVEPITTYDEFAGRERTIFNLVVTVGGDSSQSYRDAGDLGRALIAVSADADYFAGVIGNVDAADLGASALPEPTNNYGNSAYWSAPCGVGINAAKDDDSIEIDTFDGTRVDIENAVLDTFIDMLRAAREFTGRWKGDK